MSSIRSSRWVVVTRAADGTPVNVIGPFRSRVTADRHRRRFDNWVREGHPNAAARRPWGDIVELFSGRDEVSARWSFIEGARR